MPNRLIPAKGFASILHHAHQGEIIKEEIPSTTADRQHDILVKNRIRNSGG